MPKKQSQVCNGVCVCVFSLNKISLNLDEVDAGKVDFADIKNHFLSFAEIHFFA